MYSFTIESNGQLLDISGVEKKWQLLEVSGLNPPRPTTATSTITGADGVVVHNMQLPARYLEFTLHINNPCTANRMELLNVLTPRANVRVHIKGKKVQYYIDGIVDLNDYNPYTSSQTMVVSILCERPPFINADGRSTINVVSTGGFSFPFSFEEDDVFTFDEYSILNTIQLFNYGQNETGLKIEINVIEEIEDPKLINVDNNNMFFGLKGKFYPGDIIKIDTNVGAKNKVMLVHNGVETKIMNRLMRGVTWLKIQNILTLRYSVQSYNTFNSFLLVKNHDELLGI